MITYIPKPESIMYRYDDGLTTDYASLIRMWSSIDRSLKAFNRRCGVLVSGTSKPARSDASRRRSGK